MVMDRSRRKCQTPKADLFLNETLTDYQVAQFVCLRPEPTRRLNIRITFKSNRRHSRKEPMGSSRPVATHSNRGLKR